MLAAREGQCLLKRGQSKVVCVGPGSCSTPTPACLQQQGLSNSGGNGHVGRLPQKNHRPCLYAGKAPGCLHERDNNQVDGGPKVIPGYLQSQSERSSRWTVMKEAQQRLHKRMTVPLHGTGTRRKPPGSPESEVACQDSRSILHS